MSKQKTTVILIIVAILSFVAGIVIPSNKTTTGDSILEISKEGKRKESDSFVVVTNTVAMRTENKAKNLNFTFDTGYSIKVQ